MNGIPAQLRYVNEMKCISSTIGSLPKGACRKDTAFGECGEGFARISYAYSVAHITEALKGIGAFVEKLKAEKH